nr:class I SAM-dependent methyltransferase [Streptococcus catagoni]
MKNKALEVALTVGKLVPLAWFEKAAGHKILGLACGGGQQGAVFAMHGYDTTIMDFSESQLEKDREIARREGLAIETIQADMTKTFPFEDNSFDIVFCPVSNVYIEDLDNMYSEAYRVLKKGGLLMIGYMNPWVYMYDSDEVWDQSEKELTLKYSLPFNFRLLEEAGELRIDPQYGYEFSHTLEEQIQGQLKNGFAMIDFYESRDEKNRLSQYGSDYIANLSIKL